MLILVQTAQKALAAEAKLTTISRLLTAVKCETARAYGTRAV